MKHMTANMNQAGDRATLSFSPTMWGFIVLIVTAIIGTVIANERMISARPTEEKVERMIDQSLGTVNGKLDEHSRALERIDHKLDRMNE